MRNIYNLRLTVIQQIYWFSGISIFSYKDERLGYIQISISYLPPQLKKLPHIGK